MCFITFIIAQQLVSRGFELTSFNKDFRNLSSPNMFTFKPILFCEIFHGITIISPYTRTYSIKPNVPFSIFSNPKNFFKRVTFRILLFQCYFIKIEIENNSIALTRPRNRFSPTGLISYLAGSRSICARSPDTRRSAL